MDDKEAVELIADFVNHVTTLERLRSVGLGNVSGRNITLRKRCGELFVELAGREATEAELDVMVTAAERRPR